MASFKKQVEYETRQIAKSYFESKGMVVFVKNEGRVGYSKDNEYIVNYHELYSKLNDKERQELDKLISKKESESYGLFYFWLILVIVFGILGFIGMLS
jgi:hypothetical protein